MSNTRNSTRRLFADIPGKPALAILLFLTLCFGAGLVWEKIQAGDGGPRILIFSKTEFYFHPSTEAGVAALLALCRENGIGADVSDDAGDSFTEEQLQRYSAIVFLNTAGDVLNFQQEALFQRYIRAGGGYVGIHTAIDTEHNWKWYHRMLGGAFDNQTPVQEGQLEIVDTSHLSTRHLGAGWTWQDEWFNLKDIEPGTQVLLALRESSVQGGTMGDFHPVSWYREFEGGRVFYSALGHRAEAYADADFLQHLLGGIQYAIGANRRLDFSRADVRPEAEAVTADTGFVRTALVCDLYEPMELDLLPDGRILFIERRGKIKLFDPEAGTTTVVGEIPVYLDNEQGLLGMAIDPDWSNNHFVYLYYAPVKPDDRLRLARYVFRDDVLDMDSETILLEVVSPRGEISNHAGGCIEFDAQGFLYLTTGDDSGHFADGFASIDERPGYEQLDAQRTSANSMDLRGKILRIKPLSDGSYSCPADNLYTRRDIRVTPLNQPHLSDPLWLDALQRGGRYAFPRVPEYGRPEIYAMGCRNPFRLSVDDRRGAIFWGDVGPDAGQFDSLRGAEGLDELNVTRFAGFYGWPYAIGDNQPYRQYDYGTGASGAWYDPLRPVNTSPNNTGALRLPPAQPALIWYPFRTTELFPEVLNGTRCVMAGPVYYCDQYPAETRFPDAYDGKFILYEWMRGWIRMVTLDSLCRYQGMEPFAEHLRFSRPMDMLIDRKGSLWVLDYGTEWYLSNPDACLYRIDYIRGTGAAPKPLQAGVRWDLGGHNRSFYRPGEVLSYQVQVAGGQEAGLELRIAHLERSPKGGSPAKDYLPARKSGAFVRGKQLADGADCTSCHDQERTVNGPSYRAIAARYDGEASTINQLAQRIIKGGTGAWGSGVMVAHPEIGENEAREMVRWILSCDQQPPEPAPRGVYPMQQKGAYVFHAEYPGLGSETLLLRPERLAAADADAWSDGVRATADGGLQGLQHGDFFRFDRIDPQGLSGIRIALGHPLPAGMQGRIELRLGGPDGQLLGAARLPDHGAGALLIVPDRTVLPAGSAWVDLCFVAASDRGAAAPLSVDWVQFELSGK